MNKKLHQKVFSVERTQKYWDAYPQNDLKAIIHYKANIQISECFYPLLSVFEVALRNSLNRELCRHFGTTDWHLQIQSVAGLKDINQEISLAIRHISKRGETVTSSKIVSELTLGFWVRILNVEYEKILWKSLRLAFPFLLKKNRKRHKVSVPLNNIRNFRNRVYHNEPISWNFAKLEEIHSDILTVLAWLNNDLPDYAKGFSRFDNVLAQVKTELQLV